MDKDDLMTIKIFDSYGIYVMKEKRTIYLSAVITGKTAALFNLALLEMEESSPDEDIVIYIDSPGGDVRAGMSMIDTMDVLSCDVRTICVGQAYSMAAIILMCGTKGKREILPHSYVLIHQLLAGLGDGLKQASDIEIFASEVTRRKKELCALIAERTGQSEEKVTRDSERDYTLSSREALEYGIVDRVILSHKESER